MKAPIAIMSFNRPDYLASTLDSLRAQSDGTLEGREIHLFQDGFVNLYSKLKYAERADIYRCIAVFLTRFPKGRVHSWGDNIGICENFYRAESYMFDERGFEFVFFFEDDMILSPVYLAMMDILQGFAERSPRVAYFAAYGAYHAQPEEIEQRRRELVNLENHFGFGLRKSAWARIREFLGPYYKIIRGNDYARRDHRAVFDLFAKSDAVPRASSQDAAKSWACDQLGLWRCRTFVPFARYIGSRGAHMTQEAYDRMGFGRTVIVTEPIHDLDFPDDAGIDQKLAEQHALFARIKQNELDSLLASLPAAELNPMRRCTAEDVKMAYRLLLHREPESLAVIERHTNGQDVYSFIQSVVSSVEFASWRDRLGEPGRIYNPIRFPSN